AWWETWRKGALKERTGHSTWASDRPTRARTRPMMMMPMFSMPVVSKQAFQVMLADGERHPEDARNRSQSQKGFSPLGGQRGKEGTDAEDAVDPHLDHDA